MVVVDFDDGSLAILSAILFSTRYPVASAVFLIALFEADLSAWFGEFLRCQEDFAHTYCWHFYPDFFA